MKDAETPMQLASLVLLYGKTPARTSKHVANLHAIARQSKLPQASVSVLVLSARS
jgi:hypothetical protein